MKVVLDANVLIAAFAARGLCESLFELCLEKHELVASAPLLGEVREKLATKIKLPADRVEEIIEFLGLHTSSVQPADVPADACRDPDDLMVLGTAKAASASYLVTGDQDLLMLESYDGISVVTPRQFWEAQAKENSR
jgi:putative PIN family toxin of toxin-antitoxin system